VEEAAEYWPAVHDAHDDCAGSRYFPALQEVQTADALDPNPVENFPSTHAEHIDAPIELEYSPGLQRIHALDETAPLRSEKVPDLQAKHVFDAWVVEYLPGWHNSQNVKDADAVKLPAKHMMPTGRLLNVGQKLPATALHGGGGGHRHQAFPQASEACKQYKVLLDLIILDESDEFLTGKRASSASCPHFAASQSW
jgi:hypothetical protein